MLAQKLIDPLLETPVLIAMAEMPAPTTGAVIDVHGFVLQLLQQNLSAKFRMLTLA